LRVKTSPCQRRFLNQPSGRVKHILIIPRHPFGGKWQFTFAVLEIPPVDSPQTAVKMAIYSDAKNKVN
jgi:hypothetical protein